MKADAAFKCLAAVCALLVVVIMAGIALELVRGSSPSVREFGLGFLWSQSWNPVRSSFGALSSIFGTLASTAIAMAIAVPLSLVIALFLVELAPPVVSKPVGYAIELLAAIPSIIYGMWGLFVFAPFMSAKVQPILGDALGFLPLFAGPPMGIGMLSAGVILALMILPFVTAVMRDVFTMVPPLLRESAHGMGATTLEVTMDVMVPYGLKGLLGASFLGLGRAIGETMAVTFVIGNTHRIDASLFAAGNTIASTLANEFTEASEPLYRSALVELGLVLFGITIAIQAIANLWIRRLGWKKGAR